MAQQDTSAAQRRLLTARQRAQRTARRSTFRAAEVYAQGLARRGTMTHAEIRGVRRMLEFQMTRPQLRPDPATRREPVRERFGLGQVRGEWVERDYSTREDVVLLYIHGGAFISGSPRSHRGLTSELAARLRRSVFSVDYRLAPEYPFPAGPTDVQRAYAWLLESGVPADRIVVAGDSAGGHLALGLTPRAVRAGLPAPAAVVALSPVVDPSMALAAANADGRRGGDLHSRAGRALMRRFRGPIAADHPEVLLTGDDLSVLPPVLIQASADEILVADAEHYIECLHAAGGTGELRLWPRQQHVFQVAFRISAAAREALDDVQDFVERIVPSPVE